MVNLRVLILWLLYHAVGVPPCYGQTSIRLEPTILQGRCPGEVVTLTCTTTGSQILAWRSEEYIGPSGTQLEFARVNNIGDRENSLLGNSVYATLIDKSFDHLTSTLNIMLSDAFHKSSVMCVNIVTGGIMNTTISLLDEAQALSGVKSVLRRNGDMCAVDLLWNLPENFEDDVSHFTVTINDHHRADNSTTNETSTMTSNTRCNCEPHNVTITYTDRCGRTGSSTSVITMNTSQPLFDEGDVAGTTSLPATNCRFDVNDPLILMFLVITIIFGTWALCCSCCCCCFCCSNPLVNHKFCSSLRWLKNKIISDPRPLYDTHNFLSEKEQGDSGQELRLSCEDVDEHATVADIHEMDEENPNKPTMI